MYLPPERSPFYSNLHCEGVPLLEDKLLNLEINIDSCELLIMGDLNARTGIEDDFLSTDKIVPDLEEYREILNDNCQKRVSCDKVRNKFGKELLDFCKTYAVRILNGRAGEDSRVGNFTFIGPSGNSVIDYAICSDKMLQQINDFKIGERTESSHLPVIISLPINSFVERNQMKIKTNEVFTKYNFDETIKDSYRDTLSHKLNTGKMTELVSEIESSESNINDIIANCQMLIQESSECCKKSYTNKVTGNEPWFNKQCEELKSARNKALRMFRRARTLNNLNKYKLARHEYKQFCDITKEHYYNAKLESLVESANSPKSFWKKLKLLSNKKATTQHNISLAQWKEHFENLFKQDDTVSDQNIDDLFEEEPAADEIEDSIFNSEITEEEILRAVRSLKEEKAAGPDGIVPGLFIHSIDLILPIMHKLFNRLFSRGEFPEAWCDSIIVPLHKKGSLNDPANYRGISLLDIFGKIYTSVLNRRVTFYANLYNKISESQAGFRENYSTVDNAFVLQSLINKYISRKGRKLYVAFVDFKQAFDKVSRGKLWSVLQKAGFKGRLFHALTSIYHTVKAKVRSNGKLSDSFHCPTGLKQGCMLSPALFTLFINEFAEIIETSGIQGVQLFPEDIQVLILLFADDIALISDTIVGLQKQLNLLFKYCLDSKLVVNISKTKVMVFRNGGILSKHEKWYYNGTLLETVNSFTYVGLCFSMKLSFNRMCSELSNKGKHVLVSLLSSLYDYGQLPKHIFFKLFDTKVLPVLIYGSEIWGFKQYDILEQVHYYACKRFMCVGIKSCNSAVVGDCGRYPLYIETMKRCIKYWIRILKMPDSRLVKTCYNMLKYYDELGNKNWVTEIKTLLQRNGFGYIWDTQTVSNECKFISSFVQRLKDQFAQDWIVDVNDNRKLILYREFKHSFCYEQYLDVLKVRKFRHALAQIRSGHHELEIETGRYNDVARVERLCKLCHVEIEDEIHFILKCRVYNDLRIMHLPEKFYKNPNVHKFNILMSTHSCDIIQSLAKYIYYALQRRSTILNQDS